MAVDNVARGIAGKALKNSSITDEKIQESVNNYLDQNPPAQGATPEQVQQIQNNTDKLNNLIELLEDGNVRINY